MASNYLENDGTFHQFTVEQAAEVAIQLAQDDAYLSALINRNALDDVLAGGGKGRAVNVRIPSSLVARRRGMDETKTAIQLDSLAESTETITLGEHLYSAVALSEGEMNLDVRNFSEQVTRPQVRAVVDLIESDVLDALLAAENDPTDADLTLLTRKPYDEKDPVAVLTTLRRILRARGVPQDGMNVVVGPEVYSHLLSADVINFADASGSTAALREGNVGKVRGFTIVESTRVGDTDIVAFHRDAFTLAVRAPLAPAGVRATVASEGGFSLRLIQDYDTAHTAHRNVVGTFAGVAKMPLYREVRDHKAGTASVEKVEGGAAIHIDVDDLAGA